MNYVVILKDDYPFTIVETSKDRLTYDDMYKLITNEFVDESNIISFKSIFGKYHLETKVSKTIWRAVHMGSKLSNV